MVNFFRKKDEGKESKNRDKEKERGISISRSKEGEISKEGVSLGWREDEFKPTEPLMLEHEDFVVEDIEKEIKDTNNKEVIEKVEKKEKGRNKNKKKTDSNEEEALDIDDESESKIAEEKKTEEEIKSIIEDSFVGKILEDPGVTDVSYNSTHLYEQHNIKGRYLSPVQPSELEVSSLIRRIAARQNVKFTESNPILDTEISGLRINAVHKIISPFGVTMALRVSKPYRAIRDLNTLANEEVSKLLDVLMQADTNMIISGQTGSGKTELQKLLVGFIPQSKKISLMEDTMDSHLKALYPEKDINSWRTRTGENVANKITFRDLIKAGLRNNPDWLLISEIRGEEAYDFIESALTGHSVLTTIHANGAESIPSRIRNMIGQRYDMNPILLGQDIVNNIRFGLHMEMVIEPEGVRRRIREIVEYISYEDTGVVSKLIYQVKKVYDEETGEYEEGSVTSKLTDKTCNILKEKELYHLVPDYFRPGIEDEELLETAK